MQREIISIIVIGVVFTSTANVFGQPEITVAPNSLYANMYTGSSVIETLVVSNTGDFELNFDILLVPSGYQLSQYQKGLNANRQSSTSIGSLNDYVPTDASSPTPPVPILTSRTLTPANFLVVDHGKDKNFLSNYTYELISEVDLNTITINDLLQYEVLYSEPDWYNNNNLSDNMSVISGYVQTGGVVVINIAGNIGDGLGIDPFGTIYANYDGNFGGNLHNFETITDSNHSYITGKPFGGNLLEAADFRFWFETDHGHLLNYPQASHVVLNNFNDASWLEYKLGKGYVIVTTLTYGWALGGAKGDPLENLFKYSIHLAKTAWLSINMTAGTLQPGESIALEVTISSDRLIAGEHSAIILFQSNDPFTPNLEIPVVLQVANYPCGDANGDLVFDNIDLEYIREAFFYCGPAPVSLESIDFNCNDKLDFADVYLMERYINGVDPIGCCSDSLLLPLGY